MQRDPLYLILDVLLYSTSCKYNHPLKQVRWNLCLCDLLNLLFILPLEVMKMFLNLWKQS